MRLLAAGLSLLILFTGCAAHTITAPSVRGHMELLASDAMNGRGSGTRDEWIAATCIASQLRRWGIEPLGDAGGLVQAVESARTQVTVPPVLTAGPLRLTHSKEMIVQGLAALRVSGPLRKFQSGAAVAPGSVVLLPDGPISRETFIAISGATAVLTIENAQSRARWDVQGARPILLPGRIVALPAQTGGRGQTRITLDKAAHAAITALADGAVVLLEATGRSDRVELRAAHRRPPAVRRSRAPRHRAYDRVDPVDARAGAMAGQRIVQAGVAGGEASLRCSSSHGFRLSSRRAMPRPVPRKRTRHSQ